MSFRFLTNRLFSHGRYFVKRYCKRNIHNNILERPRTRLQPGATAVSVTKAATNPVFKNTTLFRFGQHARRLFVDNILNRVTTTYSSDLRTDALKKFLYGDSTPLFALIGVSLATGSGILTKDDELEGVCYEIREAVSRYQSHCDEEDITQKINDEFNLSLIDIGPPIAKGCAAVVYAAALKRSDQTNIEPLNVTEVKPRTLPLSPRNEMMSPIQNTSRFVHNFGGSVDNLSFNRPNVDNEFVTPTSQTSNETNSTKVSSIHGVKSVRFDTASNVIHSKRNESLSSSDEESPVELTPQSTDLAQYPLALKMMFNYDIQSNAMAILKAMYKETIPARRKHSNEDVDGWEKLLREQTVHLPPHPNIVTMYGVFCDQIPNLPLSDTLYPMALPLRINPNGYGRNMSLFLLMKRYNSRLCDYLEENSVSMRTRLLLFAQLLEAVAHLYRYGVAHRDLKSDNILIDLNNDVHPILVLSDFGCSLADKTNGLQLPYTSIDTDKGGNTALMAPEIITKTPGTFSILNYTKSDLWACGAIAYEIFGQSNPFYELKNASYKDNQLPALGSNVPIIVQRLIENILQRNPNKRLNPDIAANVMQLFLWAPTSWIRKGTTPNTSDILQWLLSLTTKVLVDDRLMGGVDGSGKDAFGYQIGRRTYTEYLLISSFLMRARLQYIRNALNWIHSVV
ncbi:probable serine/threonine-protein kinase samkB isoform X2 [Bradysia coprophila]|uniref:probable serine/threonine-protein kinase samkB isoform X2 n=1 Tax=Bradysia coprophila TaxID=38358 RepID=UPI00187D8C66|nr:probable serine/threonine-protein kinase samkB isoform X2 [Bradysia coprophila]